MTVEALSLTLCLVSGIFGRPAWDQSKCDERAAQLVEIAKRHGLDPRLLVAVNVQECDMREGINALVTVGEGKHKRVVGVDACPMGVRIMGAEALKPHDPVALYEISAAKMEHWKRWCERGHQRNKPEPLFSTKHHFIAHYNQGDPNYAHQVLGFFAVLTGRLVKKSDEEKFTERTKEIVRRLLFAKKRQQREQRS